MAHVNVDLKIARLIVFEIILTNCCRRCSSATKTKPSPHWYMPCPRTPCIDSHDMLAEAAFSGIVLFLLSKCVGDDRHQEQFVIRADSTTAVAVAEDCFLTRMV